jgi:hypothetical protein
VNSRDADSNHFLTDILGLLEASSRSGGLTPGQLRAGLAAKAGVQRNLGEVRAACHELWQRDEVVIEPPGQNRREYRIWHASHRRSPQRVEPVAPRGRSTREGGAEENFRVTLCGQLAGEWARTGCRETREVLRRLLSNFGAERVERPDDVVPFKGRRHECERSVLPGAPVRVTEAGWILRQGVGEYLLAKARVVPA